MDSGSSSGSTQFDLFAQLGALETSYKSNTQNRRKVVASLKADKLKVTKASTNIAKQDTYWSTSLFATLMKLEEEYIESTKVIDETLLITN